MDLLSASDALLLKVAFGASIAYSAQSFLSYAAQKPVEPLIPSQKPTPISSNIVLSTPTRSIKKQLQQTKKSCIYFYGSQTGTAEKLASILSKEALARFGIEGIVADLDDYDYDDLLALSEQNVVIFLLATYGEGEPTDNALPFDQYCANLAANACAVNKTLYYATFGLGNSSYQFFNEMAKRVDSSLNNAGAHRIGSMGLGDDGNGTLENDFLLWQDELLPLLAKHLGLVEQKRAPTMNLDIVEVKNGLRLPVFIGEPNAAHRKGKLRGPWTASNPYPARVAKSLQLFGTGNRKCLHVEFDINDSTMTYETGDHLGVWPENSNLEVERFLQVFGLNEKKDSIIHVESRDSTIKLPIPSHTTYDAVVRYYLDICAPVSRYLLATLVEFVQDENPRIELLRLLENNSAFEEEVKGRHLNLAQLLQNINSSRPWTSIPVPLLFENISKLQPRYYSISSSSLHSRKRISITAVVESQIQQHWPHEFKGVATNFLLSQHSKLNSQTTAEAQNGPQLIRTHQLRGPRYKTEGVTSLIHVRRSKFRLPKQNSTPIIMIGPGTGVAPFRAFVQERAKRNSVQNSGRTMLFYGCRQQKEDYLYAEEWKELEGSFQPGIFSIDVAFSREDPSKKTYVQHLLLKRAPELRSLILQEGACIYVCGDAHRMAKDVFKTMVQIIAEDNRFKGSLIDAEACLKGMKKSKRWLEDVW